MKRVGGKLPTPDVLTSTPASALYCIPRAFVNGETAQPLIMTGQALGFLGNWGAFAAVEIAIRNLEGVARYATSVSAFIPWQKILRPVHKERFSFLTSAMAEPRRPFAGLPTDRPLLMGIVNVTPDSFSDGGDHATPDAAITHALSLAKAGADILDVGGESTRPGAEPVDPASEQQRVIPVVQALAERGLIVSIDTRHSSTMAAALAAGARIVNDVTALTNDQNALTVVAKHKAHIILMHMQGDPKTMQGNPDYEWAPADVFDVLSERVAACEDAGINSSLICVDPGIGFGKTDEHNMELINSLGMFHGLGCAVMLGASRKSFIGRLSGTVDPKARVPGSIAAALAGASQGASILRVHDVTETYQALRVWRQNSA